MYKETLAQNCPFNDAKEDNKLLYRIFQFNDTNGNNFTCFAKLFPNRRDLQNNCKAFGISLFQKKETAIEYAKRNTKLGNFIASIQVRSNSGKLFLTNIETGHYTLWLYRTFNPVEAIQEIEAIT